MSCDAEKYSQKEIIEQIQNGDLSLAPDLYEQTQKIIAWVTWREWRRDHVRRNAAARGLEAEDLLQEGYFIMLNAAKSYNPGCGTRFSTYLFARTKAAIKSMTAPRMIDNVVSISEPYDAEENSSTIEEKLADPSSLDGYEAIERAEYIDHLRENIDESLRELTDLQAAIIRGKYYGNRLHKELAEDLKVGEARIGAIEERALRILRQSEHLRQYREDVIQRYGYGRGLGGFKHTNTSPVELAVMKLEELEDREKARADRLAWDEAIVKENRRARSVWLGEMLTGGEKDSGNA